MFYASVKIVGIYYKAYSLVTATF